MYTTFHAILLISPAVTLYESNVKRWMSHPGIPQHTLLFLFAFRIDKVAVDMKLKVSFLDPIDVVDLAEGKPKCLFFLYRNSQTMMVVGK